MVLSIQDVDDDREVGVKSTALLFGPRPKPWLAGFATGMTCLLLLAGLNAGQAWPYFMGVGVCASHLAWQVHICVLQVVCLLQMFLEWGVSVPFLKWLLPYKSRIEKLQSKCNIASLP